MRNGETTVISFRAPIYLAEIIKKHSDNRKIKVSELVEKIVIQNISNYEELTPLEKKYVDLYNKNLIADVHKELRSHNAERIYFLKNIRNSILKLTNDNIRIDSKLIIENMNCNVEIAKTNGWKKEAICLKKYISLLKKNDLEAIRSMRGVDYAEKNKTSFIEYRKDNKN